MGRCVVKVAPDDDLYVVWSSVVDAPVFWGTRGQTLEFLVEDYLEDLRRRARDSLDRADERGTSDRTFNTFGWGDEEGEILEQRGVLHRRDLRALLDSYDPTSGEFTAADSLVEPFDRST